MKINLTKKDYKYIDSFMKFYNLSKGKGIENILSIFLSYYKFNSSKIVFTRKQYLKAVTKAKPNTTIFYNEVNK